ncbi:acetate kinase [Saccharopolyspora gloriosae]|uniref:Acetate kinase n=1 Tax=Saccharopolyspora gloriosae TaxID=455344 RepID=A0A840N9P4_9PSEU|nr:acetate/propionate family kinase [Saccharopolyspora gloriosae]MBB5068344.1 acetate kinase [Saccharopolyspora gloriosae]
MRVLTVNAGSSSLKLRLLHDDEQVAGHDVQRWRGEAEPIRDFFHEHGAQAIGHRVVHGGPKVLGPALLDDRLVDHLAGLTDLAPLHQARALDGIRAAGECAPATPAVACVDTAFHTTLPEAARTYALPKEWNERWTLRRYGFHGLSHAYASRRGAEIAGIAAGRVLSCHLGAGASLAAVRGGRCVDTTMGFTPDEGLVMATRSGSIDPGLLGWLLTSGKVGVDELCTTLQKRSGLAGLSGGSGDLRDVLAARTDCDLDAELAYDVYAHSLLRHAGAMVAAMGGLDLLVFTGGVGEHQPPLRAELAENLGFLGVEVDSERNAATGTDADISTNSAAVRTVVVESREDVEIARQTREVLTRPSP